MTPAPQDGATVTTLHTLRGRARCRVGGHKAASATTSRSLQSKSNQSRLARAPRPVADDDCGARPAGRHQLQVGRHQRRALPEHQPAAVAVALGDRAPGASGEQGAGAKA